MEGLGGLLIKAIIAGMLFIGVGGFFIWKFSHDTIQKDLNRLSKETEVTHAKQSELNAKIKEASEELSKRKSEADALVAKMTEDATAKAKEERDKIVAKARIEGEEIIVKANNTKEDIRKAIVKDMDMKTIDVTALVLEEVLGKRGKPALAESMIGEFLEGLMKMDMEMLGEEIKDADIVTATPLSDALKNRLSDALQTKLGRSVAINQTTDPKVLSGSILKFGSLNIDGSLATMVRENAISMKERIEKGLLKI